MACSVLPIAPHRAGCLPHQMMMRVPAAPAPTPAPAPAPEELRLSDLDWIGDLGAGGFARVSKARHRRTGAVFALKMSFDADPDVVEEAEVLRRAAGSPHVVDCHALLRGPAGEPAFALEFMDAGSLGRVLCRRQRGSRGVPEPALAEAAAHCVVGLAQLHSRGVAHLDVKPDNFLASSRGEIKISDFNTSRILYGSAGERLQVPITAGTLAYFSPERFAPRARAGPHGAMAADVWGLGVTVLELFLGRFAVVPDADKASAAELELAICHGEPLRVPEEAEASAELRGFVAACLQWEPTRRATVPQLLRHPFLTRRDVEASRRALRDLIVETL
ncbi:hypothetical protein GQ55_2G226600 [Panicum hallii var. hallii]|uniref:Protein kinase domain-containing protein n=1 Tax=Panicum hallii var. hallii TaxID=1504633 RepID=A0A2T7ERD9_9POAL|nr:hypothetical protein GQ55_2G226600 [Panicum hallii var. hallii]